MGKRRRNTEVRKPIKAKGVLPAPRVSPARVHVAWHKRRSVQVVLVLVGVVTIGLAAWQFMRARSRAEEGAAKRREVRQFERSLTVAEGNLNKVLTEMTSIPDQFKSGQVSGADLKAKTEEWLKSLRELDGTLRTRQTPQRLLDARASLLQGVVVYIDAAKVFQLAADSTDASVRDRAVAQGRNLVMHGASVYQVGQLALAREKVRVGLVNEEEAQNVEGQEIPLPEEEAPQPEPTAAPAG